MKNICIDPSSIMPISCGAAPAGNLSQYINLSIRYIIPMIALMMAHILPKNVAMRSPILVYDVTDSIAASYNL